MVRLARQMSVNTPGTCAHLCATTPPTPPAPIIKTLPISVSPNADYARNPSSPHTVRRYSCCSSRFSASSSRPADKCTFAENLKHIKRQYFLPRPTAAVGRHGPQCEFRFRQRRILKSKAIRRIGGQGLGRMRVRRAKH